MSNNEWLDAAQELVRVSRAAFKNSGPDLDELRAAVERLDKLVAAEVTGVSRGYGLSIAALYAVAVAVIENQLHWHALNGPLAALRREEILAVVPTNGRNHPYDHR